MRFKHDVSQAVRAATLRAARVSAVQRVGGADVVAPQAGTSPARALISLQRRRAVAWAERSLQARAAYVPNDSGVASAAGPAAGWAAVQWELNGPFGINAPAAWSQASKLGGSGGRGVTVAILDSGVAYTTRGPYLRSPDLAAARFVRGFDFIDNDQFPSDEFGHGTFVASIIGATANNGYGTVGVAYRARIMPVRVLDYEGKSDAVTIARGIDYAVRHERRRRQPLARALRRAAAAPDPAQRHDLEDRPQRAAQRAGGGRRRRVGDRQQLRPARPEQALRHAGDQRRRDDRARLPRQLLKPRARDGRRRARRRLRRAAAQRPNCHPDELPGRDISGVSFKAGAPGRFEMLPAFRGTSSAAPHVTGIVALVLASGVLGPHPTPGEVERHIERTAHDLGRKGHDRYYGAGLVDATAATAPLRPSG